MVCEHQGFPEDGIDQSGDDCIENPLNDIIQNNQPLDEKPVELVARISYPMKFAKKY